MSGYSGRISYNPNLVLSGAALYRVKIMVHNRKPQSRKLYNWNLFRNYHFDTLVA
jgi:hypothetical protein